MRDLSDRPAFIVNSVQLDDGRNTGDTRDGRMDGDKQEFTPDEEGRL